MNILNTSQKRAKRRACTELGFYKIHTRHYLTSHIRLKHTWVSVSMGRHQKIILKTVDWIKLARDRYQLQGVPQKYVPGRATITFSRHLANFCSSEETALRQGDVFIEPRIHHQPVSSNTASR